MKKFLAILLVMMLLVPTLALGEEVMAKQKWGFIVGSFEHNFYQVVASGIREASEKLGLVENQTYFVTDANLEADKAIDNINNFIANQCTAIALAANDASGVLPGIQAGVDAGVLMFNFDSAAADQTNITCFVGTDNYQGGVLGGQELLRFSKDGDTVAIIGNPVGESTLDRENGALEALKGADRKVLSGYNYEGDANIAQTIMESILISNPEVAAVFVVGDPAAIGALAAIKAAGSECKIIGFDGNPEAFEAMADEENGKYWVSEVCQSAKMIGMQIVEQMHKYVTTGEVDSDGWILIAPYVVDHENLAEYL